MSAATLAEVLIVGGAREVADELGELVTSAGMQVFDVTRRSALEVAIVYRTWGRGYHPARLNYGDCFAYELASRHQCPLLFIGDDFSKTDIKSVL